VYITAIDKNMPENISSVILVYRTGLPSVAAFYDVFNINYKYNDMLIDATGAFGDYVVVAMGSILKMIRQYELPVLVFQDSITDFDFNLSYTNDPQNYSQYLSHSNVKIINFPQALIVANETLNKTGFLDSVVNY
jgi:hypothetical protein